MTGVQTCALPISQGRGQYVMEPSHYAEVPKSVAEAIIAKRVKKED